MRKRVEKESAIPKFANEQAEADWWASEAGREFLTSRPRGKKLKSTAGSKLVAKLAASHRVQIALRRVTMARCAGCLVGRRPGW